MSCNGFEKFSRGDWTQQQFEAHYQTCQNCHIAFENDQKLLGLSRSLQKKIDAPTLWERIETELQNESKIRASDNYRWIFRMVAILILAIGIGFIVHRNWPIIDSGLLAESAIQKVERQELQYEHAIEELEKIVTPHLSQLDQELMLLYRDRLETIDEQIDQCKEALEMNPANAHIRRYLLAALQDKKETLKEIIDLKS